MILAMCGLLGLSIYLTGIVLGMICMMIGQGVTVDTRKRENVTLGGC